MHADVVSHTAKLPPPRHIINITLVWTLLILYSYVMKLDTRLLQKVAAYTPDSQALASIKDVPILFTVGIVAAGKNALQRRIMALHPDEYSFIVSHVTRKPRMNKGIMEREGVEYHFIDFETAEKMLDQGRYIEANIVHYDDIYGSSIEEIERIKAEGKIGITDLEIKGVHTYVGLGLNVKPVFVLPPDYEIWKQRLLERYGSSVDWPEVRKRMKTALEELQLALQRDYLYLVINGDLDQTAGHINRIAHGEPIERRPAAALELAQTIADRISEKLANWQEQM